MDVQRIKKALLYTLYVWASLFIFSFSENIIKSIIVLIDYAIIVGTWYLEFLVLRKIFRFMTRNFRRMA